MHLYSFINSKMGKPLYYTRGMKTILDSRRPWWSSFLLLGLLFLVVNIHGEEESKFEIGRRRGTFLEHSQTQISPTRGKRDLTNDIFDAAGSLGVGDKYINKFRTLVEGVPPKMQTALIDGDFSNVTAQDVQNLNVTVLEYLPPKVIAKMNSTLLNPVIDKLMQYNRPMAMSRVVKAAGDKLDSNQLLDKIKQRGIRENNKEAASILLYTALNKMGDKEGGLDVAMINRLSSQGLLSIVPEEQLMKVKDSYTAEELLRRLYPHIIRKPGVDPSPPAELREMDDQALIYKLTETAYGLPSNWSEDTIRSLSNQIVSQLPSQLLKDLSPETIYKSVGTFTEASLQSPMQGKSVVDGYLKNLGIDNSKGAEIEGTLMGAVSSLGSLAAFVNPSVTKEPGVLQFIVQACDSIGLPAPLEAVNGFLKTKLDGGKKRVEDLNYGDIMELPGTVMKNAPPAVVSKALDLNAINEFQFMEIAGSNQKPIGGSGGNSFFQGVIAQVASKAVAFFTGGGRGTPQGGYGGFDIRRLPGAFLGALGIRGISSIDNRNMNDELLDKLRKNPEALDDAQKAILLKKLKDNGLLDSSDLPPEVRALLPRKKGEPAGRSRNDILKGLPADSDLRLAHGEGRKLRPSDLERDPYLVGTLTPKQVLDLDLEEIPSVLAVLRKSKDGPQQQTLEELSKRFAEYIRVKSEDFDAPDKKLLKYISPAQVSKLPASVLAYFIDPKQTSKLPPDVRKEIMIALGELSTKDHASIPSKTREEIILQGLDAIDKLTGGESKRRLDVPELAAIGGGVADLPPGRIEKLTPIAVEQGLEIIQGVADDDNDGLLRKACLSKEQKEAWRRKVVELYGAPKSWDTPTISSLCCVISTLLNEKDLRSIKPEALATCRCASDSAVPLHLQELKKGLDANCVTEKGSDTTKESKDQLDKIRAELAFDLDDLESQIITGRRRRRSSPDTRNQLSCFEVRIAGSAALFTKEQLESLPHQEVEDCLYELGVDPLPQDNARVVWDKLLKSKSKEGKVDALQPQDIRFAGHVLSGIRLSDIKDLKFQDWDIVFPFGQTTGLSKSVLEKMAANLQEKQGSSLRDFSSNDLVVTRNILCGYSPERLSEIRSDAFTQALPVLRNLDEGCEQTRLATLAGITMRPDVFGDPTNWTGADIRGSGILLAGLPPRGIESIPAEAFIGVTPSVAAALPPEVLQLLSPDQVSNLPRFSAMSLSPTQKESLQSEGKERLEALVKGPAVTSGASGGLVVGVRGGVGGNSPPPIAFTTISLSIFIGTIFSLKAALITL